MTTVTVDETMVGQILASDEMLISVTLKTAPTQYGNDYLSLTDNYYVKDEQNNDVLAQELGLYHLHVCTTPVGPDSVLFSKGKYRFANLVVKSIPPGCTLEVETGPIPAPPVLTSLSPDTAVSGDPDFTLSCIGTGFDPSTVIRFGDFDEPTTFVSDTEVTTIVKPSLFAPATVPVYTHEGSVYSSPIDFTFTEPVVP